MIGGLPTHSDELQEEDTGIEGIEATSRNTIDLEVVANDANPTIDATSPSLTAAQTNGVSATKVQNNLKQRRRTKTGCFTCRKRRIKCGEERPTCANCIKSKRSCEGPGWAAKGNGVHYPPGVSRDGAAGQLGRSQSGSGAQNQLPAILPRPMHLETQPENFYPSSGNGSTWAGAAPPTSASQEEFTTPTQPSRDLPPRMLQMYRQQDSGPSASVHHSPTDVLARNPADSTYFPPLQPQQTTESESSTIFSRLPLATEWSQTSVSTGPPDEYHHPVQMNPSLTSYPSADTNTSFSPHQYLPSAQYAQMPVHLVGLQQEVQTPYHEVVPKSEPYTDYENNVELITSYQNYPTHNLEHGQYTPHLSNHQYGRVLIDQKVNQQPQQLLSSEPYPRNNDEDDDYYDVDSDEEGGASDKIAVTPQNDLGLILALRASQDDRVPRSYTTFVQEHNILSTYQPTFTASPLMDALTARVFCHFITATGPTMSIYERHPTNPQVMFTGAPVPKAQQSLWTYTLPMMALSNQCLLHAMLALASLHISSLQGTPPTSSLKHYHFALRRIGKAVATPSKRTQVATIAATLILGHYEASTAEHSKWNSHLAGARQLLMEIDFRGMTKHIKEEKVRKNQSLTGYHHDPYDSFSRFHNFAPNIYIPRDDQPDESFVSQLMGWKIRYDEYGRIIDENVPTRKNPMTEKEIETYKTQCDLFWWFCKQDIYQSIISGNRLLLPYDRWVHCPPRAPVGRLDATYGTMDHLILVMGRIADFAARDQVRKRKVLDSNGGQWRPPPGMFPGPPPGGPPPGTPGMGPPNSSQSPNQPRMPSAPHPPFYGMIPPTLPPRMPDAFTQAPRDKIYVPEPFSEDFELQSATVEAESEWREIQHVIELFEESLGPDFEPLADDMAAPIVTPFGPALQYRTYPIACIWVMFLVGKLIAARMHPSMPPAAMMAAGIAAQKTAHIANTIGRICCGLQFPPENQPLNPSLGAALMESTCGMFFAGVQYMDPHQRNHIITRLTTIARATGFASAQLIAAGCETSWIKMAEAGRGPPYKRRLNTKAKDDRVAGRNMPKGDELDRQLIYLHPGTRVHWAMGILGMEEDFKDLRIMNR